MPGPRRLLATLLPILLAGTAYAADPALERHVQDLLFAYEDPPTAEEIRALGPGADEVLLACATDASRLVTFRARAVSALGWRGGEVNRSTLLGLARDAAQPGILRRSAIHGLANGWGDAEAGDIAAFLADPDVQTRMAAVRALGRLSDPVRRPLLEARLAVEPNTSVRTVIARVLATTPE